MNEMKKYIIYVFVLALSSSCASKKEIIKYGQHYKKYQDYKSLVKALELIPTAITTAEVKRILGDPIDNGFDYRYLTDSISPNKCAVGAVFNIDKKGIITHSRVNEICE
ncbi:hypothetical protein FBBAL38_11704 [Flavobacteria bacterium BAL38]|nr:hypothetical protein FBBAL38_11704 [Flavobacteria bacterium BAL38]